MASIKHNGRTLDTVVITPEIAQQWLVNYNRDNRPLMKTVIERYARAMRENRWTFAGDPIRFAKDGRLLDGQHRLEAIVASSTTQVMVVLRGADDGDQNVMDAGAGRRTGQQLSMNGWKHGNVTAATIRMVMRWHGGALISGNYNPSVDEAVRFGSKYQTRLEVSVQHAVNVYARVPLRRPAVGAVAFTAFDLAAQKPEILSAAEVNEFFTSLATGADLATDSPILALRNKAHVLKGEGTPESHHLWYVIRTWNAWRQNEKLTKLQLPRGTALNADHLKLN